MREVARTSKGGYFMAIKAAKNKHRSPFLLTRTPQNEWTAKRFVFGRAQPRCSSLPEAETPQQMSSVLLDHFVPPQGTLLPPRPGADHIRRPPP